MNASSEMWHLGSQAVQVSHLEKRYWQQELVLSVDTVKRHVYNIFSKLGVKKRIKAVARARDLGLLSKES